MDREKSARTRVIAWMSRVITGDARRRRLLAPLGPILFIALVGGLVVAGLILDVSLSLPAPLRAPWRYIVGMVLIAGGAILTAASMAAFFSSRGTPSPLSPPPVLLETGLYAHLRNPMLLGEILIGLGSGLAMGSFAITFVFVPLFALLLVLEIKLVEEPELERRLGEPYRSYRRRVPMFLPRLRRRP